MEIISRDRLFIIKGEQVRWKFDAVRLEIRYELTFHRDKNKRLTRTFLYNNSSLPANWTFAMIESVSSGVVTSVPGLATGEAVADA